MAMEMASTKYGKIQGVAGEEKLPGDDEGAFHSAELWYMFETLDRCWRPMTEQDHVLAGEMADYWCNFARTGNPGGEGLKEWKPCGKEDSFVKVFDVPSEKE